MKTILMIATSLIFTSLVHANDNYYSQFQFKVSGECSDPENLWFHYVATWDDFVIGMDSDNRPIYVGVRVQLFKDKTYWVEYNEFHVDEIKPDGGKVGDSFYFERSGLWSVQGDRIELEGLAVGNPAKVTLSKGIVKAGFSLKFLSEINDPRFKNKTLSFVKVYGNTGPEGVSINEYCGLN